MTCLPFLFLIGIRAGKIAEVNYNSAKTIERGRAVMKDKKKFFRKKVTDEEEEEVEDEGDHIDDDEGKQLLAMPHYDISLYHIILEDRV